MPSAVTEGHACSSVLIRLTITNSSCSSVQFRCCVSLLRFVCHSLFHFNHHGLDHNKNLMLSLILFSAYCHTQETSTNVTSYRHCCSRCQQMGGGNECCPKIYIIRYYSALAYLMGDGIRWELATFGAHIIQMRSQNILNRAFKSGCQCQSAVQRSDNVPLSEETPFTRKKCPHTKLQTKLNVT